MKTSIPLQLSILCSFALMVLSSFQIGAHYAAKPYRAWFADARLTDPRLGVEFTQIGMQQSHTLLLVSYLAAGFSLLGLGVVLFHVFRRKEPIQLLVPTRGNET